MEGVLGKTSYLERYSKNRMIAFFFTEAETSMINMSCINIDTDFTDSKYIAYAVSNLADNLIISKQTEAYPKDRSAEIWEYRA